MENQIYMVIVFLNGKKDKYLFGRNH